MISDYQRALTDIYTGVLFNGKSVVVKGRGKWLHSKPIIVPDWHVEDKIISPEFSTYLQEVIDLWKPPIFFMDMNIQFNAHRYKSFDFTLTEKITTIYRGQVVPYGFSVRTTFRYNLSKRSTEVFLSMVLAEGNIKI